MRSLILATFCLATCFTAQAQTPTDVVQAALERTISQVRYDPAYIRLDYPGGDVPADMGVCSDVVIRTFRNGLNFDFQKAVHEDMKSDFQSYPKIWGLSRPDKNIDHRRVPNLETYLTRMGASVPITADADDYLPGDIVSWRLFRGGTPHIGIVTDGKSATGIPLIVHNIGAGPREENILFKYDIHGHFRFLPEANMAD